MNQAVDYEELDVALRGCGSSWSAAQTHGLLCGSLSIYGFPGVAPWRAQVLAEATAEQAECQDLLERLAAWTSRQLAERQSEFEVLLPGDDEDPERRAAGLAEWAEGFLHGLVANTANESLKRRLAEEPLSDLIRDLLEITRAAVGEDDSDEETEHAYTELVEYVRVAAQLAYEHLADVREASAGNSSDMPRNTLH